MKKRAILRLSAASTYVKSANTSLGIMISCMSLLMCMNGLSILLLSLRDLTGSKATVLNRYIVLYTHTMVSLHLQVKFLYRLYTST